MTAPVVSDEYGLCKGGRNMSLETSKKVLKISGILSLIFGVIGLLMGILVFATGGMIATGLDMNDADNAAVAGISLMGGIVTIIAGIVAIIEGVFSLRGAKDSAKIMPAWIFAILGVISGVIGIISDIAGGSDIGTIVGAAFALCISVLIFLAANTIKQSR